MKLLHIGARPVTLSGVIWLVGLSVPITCIMYAVHCLKIQYYKQPRSRHSKISLSISKSESVGGSNLKRLSLRTSSERQVREFGRKSYGPGRLWFRLSESHPKAILALQVSKSRTFIIEQPAFRRSGEPWTATMLKALMIRTKTEHAVPNKFINTVSISRKFESEARKSFKTSITSQRMNRSWRGFGEERLEIRTASLLDQSSQQQNALVSSLANWSEELAALSSVRWPIKVRECIVFELEFERESSSKTD